MCGITGIFDTRGKRDIDRAVLHRMNESQFHRGPDEGGLHVEPGVGLGHRRLSIIDLSTGQQPLYNEDQTVCVVFNGEIYNYQELIPELQALGHIFHTRSDTEVIVHAWESWGAACVDRFRGMFAFALWDRNRETLFPRPRPPRCQAALLRPARRWHLPLRLGTQVACSPTADSSETSIPVPSRNTLPSATSPNRAPSSSKPRSCHRPTPFCSARGQPVGEPREYWDVHFTLDNPISDADACAELTHRLEESIKLRMISEVPLGAFLSGGVDSSAVVAIMAGLSNTAVNTCSIGFSDPAFNESEFAKMVADRYRTNHHLDIVESDDFDLIDTLARLYDEPYADSSAIPTYRVCQLARKHVTVALSGDGGDESFGGYRRYKLHLMEEKMRSALPPGLRRSIFGTLGKLYPKADWAPRFFRAKTTFEGIARTSVESYFHSMSLIRDPMRQQLYSNSFRSTLGGYSAIDVFNEHARKANTDDPLGLIQYIDTHTYLDRRHQHQGRPGKHGALT